MANSNDFQIIVPRFPPRSGRAWMRINCTVDDGGNLNLNFEDRTNPDALSNATEIEANGRALAIAGGTSGAGTTGNLIIFTDGDLSQIGNAPIRVDELGRVVFTGSVQAIVADGIFIETASEAVQFLITEGFPGPQFLLRFAGVDSMLILATLANFVMAINTAEHYEVDNLQVVGPQQAAIPDATILTNLDTTNAILAVLRTHGLIAT